ncbi:hypothetical protein GCU60_19710 [Blastococcus saxobsidens]|uniref:Camelysin-like metallo-endopeptidase n=1 Tax=Blastococcus saxobsidens TaxID=138336 RepID=A0A6L9W7A0_9ACTN|nr:TasA family protein [Blastococcus saxobsidens]NEK87966.1 hypothetical protein [Blastococcus saxobsidens]
MSTTATASSSTARKIVGSLGVIGAAAAVAGLGTFGTFTDSSTPVNATIDSGTLSISATQVGTLPLSVSGFVPGDSITRAVTLYNDGNLPFASITMGASVTKASILTTDAANGLQKSVRSCAVAWVQSGNTYTCASGEKLLGSGPVTADVALTGAASLAAHATDHIAYTISLPTTADNTFQGQTSAFALTFTGVQRTGTAR